MRYIKLPRKGQLFTHDITTGETKHYGLGGRLWYWFCMNLRQLGM